MSYKFVDVCTVIISGLGLSGDCDPFWSGREVVVGFCCWFVVCLVFPPVRTEKSPSFLAIDGEQYCDLELLHMHASLYIISD